MLSNLNPFKKTITEAHSQLTDLKQKGDNFKQKLFNLGVRGLAIVLGSILISFAWGVWWSFVPVCVLVGIFSHSTPAQSYALGLTAMTLLWGTYASLLNGANMGILAGRVSQLLGGAVTGAQLIYVTGLLGGIVGGFSTMLGATFRDLLLHAKFVQMIFPEQEAGK